MRGEFLRCLIDQIDVNRDKVYNEYMALTAEEGTSVDADRDFVAGRYLFLNGEYQESMLHYEAAIEKYRKLSDLSGECYALIYLSMDYREIQEIVKARQMLRKAHDLGIEMRDQYAVLFSIINSIALYSVENRPQDAESLSERTLAMVEEVAHPKLRGDFYNNTGQIYLNLERFDEALRCIKIAHDSYLEHYGDRTAVNVLIAWINMVFILIRMNRPDDALVEVEDIEKIIECTGYDSGIAIELTSRKTDIYFAMGDYEKAYEYALKTIEHREKWFEMSIRKPRIRNYALRHELDVSQESLFAKNEELSRNNELLEEMIKTNELIKNIGSQLTATQDLDRIFEIVSSEMSHVLPFNTIAFGLLEGDRVVVRHAMIRDLPELDLPLFLPLDADTYILPHCIIRNIDLKINVRTDFEKYVPNKVPAGTNTIEHSAVKSNHSAIFCRLMRDGKPFGVITIQNGTQDSYGEMEFEAVKSIAAFMSIAIINSIKSEEIKEKARELERLTLLDPLTKLLNRRSYRLKLNELEVKKRKYLLVFADLNHLKFINDTYGHEMGDKYLTSAADILREECRGDLIFRLSGDEFAALMVDVSREELYEIFMRIRQRCKDAKVGPYPLAVALGSAYRESNPTMKKMFTNAELRMYLDKHDYYMTYQDTLKRREF